MILRTTSLIVSFFLGAALADKDDAYYMAGSGNPNVDLKMYWSDADNILTDLDQFSTLYVEFHHCAWTMMKYPDDGNDVDESDYWYQGKTPPMGANVAFSLYGSLAGESFKGCSKDTFIKSFYTNAGFAQFAKAMSYAGVSGFTNYYYADDDNDDGYASFTSKCGGGYGVGCTYSEGFATLKYSGDYCYPENATKVTDKMYDLNQAMLGVQCQQIYDANNNPGYVYGTPLELLASSSSCFYQNFWSPEGECPDPYGKISYYQENFNAGIKQQEAEDPFVYQQKLAAGKNMMKMGFAMLLIAGAIMMLHRKNIIDKYVDPKVKELVLRINKRNSNPTTEPASTKTSATTDGPPGATDLVQLSRSHSSKSEKESQTGEKKGVMT